MITSGSNPRIAQLRTLHSPKGRDAAALFLIEGPHLLEAALDAHIIPRLIVFDPDGLARSAESRRLLDRIIEARANGAEALEATPPAIERACDARTPQGVVGAVALEDLAPDKIRARRRGRARPLLLALDALADPGNMGTILRSALAADVDEALLGPDCVDPFAPKVVRAGAGAHFHLPVRAGLRWPDIAERFAGAPAAEQVLVAEASGHVAYDEVDLTRRTVLIIGNEAHGVSRQAAALATERVSIPMWNKVESLNAGIAASVILFEAARQRRALERA
ncbi:MAG TPA: RNA methyltransferase [Ktedonobacterales bacterium]